MLYLTIGYVAALIICLVSFFLCWVKIQPDKYLVLTRTFPLLPNPPAGHFIAGPGQQGLRAKVYSGEGWHFIPFVNIFSKTEQRDLFEVPAGKFGLVEALDGEPIGPGKIVAEKVVECANFTDGDAFLKGGGQMGTQIQTLPPGKYAINENKEGKNAHFKITQIDRVNIGTVEEEIEISIDGTKSKESVYQIGLVTLNIGKEIDEKTKRLVGVHVDGHNNFQDLGPFMDKLEKGVQLDVLEPGSYALNNVAVTHKVMTVPFIRNGEVGVIISSYGDEPLEDDLVGVEIDGRGRVGAILKPGIEKRGILPNVVDPGPVPFRLANNTVYKLIRVHTAPVAIDWATHDESTQHGHPKGSFMRFDPIEVVTFDGFTVPVEAELIVSVSRIDAPKIVAIGGLKEIISNLVVPIFDDTAKALISQRPLIDLITKRAEVRNEIQAKVKEEIQKSFFLTVVSFRISEFDFESDIDAEVSKFVDVLAQTATAERQVDLIAKQKDVQQARIELENLRAQADNQPILVKADYQKQASSNQSETIKNRAENLKGLEAIQALIADPEAIPGVVNALTSLLQNLTGKKSDSSSS
jgi:hypothetical protein